MYFSKLPFIIFRDYPKFGYLTDNRNYGYDTYSRSRIKVGDRILSKSGSIFYSILTDEPQSISEISRKLHLIYSKVPLEEIQKDAVNFFMELSKDGFIRYSESNKDLSNSYYFSYDNITSSILDETTNEEDIKQYDINWFSKYRLSRIHLNISEPCNEHCTHCYFPDHIEKRTMSKDLFDTILDQCIYNRVLNITISGGEPLLNKNLTYFIKKCRDHNFSINILSNLTLLTESLVKEFASTPLLSVQTSLYSMDEEIHDSITNVKGSCIKTKHAIEMLRSHNIPMQINCPVMKQNKDSYIDVINWANTLNIDASSDYMLFGCFDGSSNNLKCRLDLEEITELLTKENKIRNLDLVSKKSSSITSVCPVCQSSLCISPAGDIYPCEGWQSLVLGNIKHDSLTKIWESSSTIQTLRNLRIQDFPECNNCKEKLFCSICLIRNVNESSHLSYKDINPYFCSIAKIKKNIYQRKSIL